MIRTCLFDLGNVLVYFSHERMCEQMANVFRTSATELREALFASGLLYGFETGAVSEEEFHRKLEARFDRSASLADLMEAAANIFWLNDSMPPLLERLKSRGMRLVLLSNTCRPHIQFVRRNFQVLEFFDDLVLSCDVGAIKPEDRIFEAAKQAIGCAPHECFYTDDIAPYVEAGELHGFQARLFTGAENLVSALGELGVEGLS